MHSFVGLHFNILVEQVSGSGVSIVTRPRAGRSGNRIPAGGKIFLRNVQTGSGAQPASCQWVPRVKRPGHEVDHLPPSNIEVEWSRSSPPPVCLYDIEGEDIL
jgi:hypothetical protein